MKKYKQRKAKGLVSLEKDGTGFLIKDKNFNPEDGSETSDKVERQTIAGIDLLIADATATLDDLKQLKKDAAAL